MSEESPTTPDAPTPPAPPPPPSPPPVQRNKLIAAVFCLLAPGLGQVFVGHTLRGIAWGVSAPLFFLFFVLASGEPSPTSLLKTFIGLVLAAYVGSAIDVILLPSSKHRTAAVPVVVIYALSAFITAPFITVLLRAFVVEAFKIPSGAMIPSVFVGDHLFSDKAIYRKRAPHRGEVIVFKYPEHPEQDFIKRVIAIPGDTLTVKDGHPSINEWEVPSCRVGKYHFTEAMDGSAHDGEIFVEFLEASAYLIFLESGSLLSGEFQGPFHAKDDFWVLGDNRNNSHDSRMWFGGVGGGVPRDHVRARARTIWLAMDGNRRGIDLAGDPVAPTDDLAAPLATCMSKRPSVKNATPPSPPPSVH